MKAVLCVEHGPPEKLVVKDVPTPEPGRGQVRISVKAVGVNFPDTLIIQNLYQFKPALPFSPGGECAGVVSAVGEGVADIAVGDEVIAMTGHGAMAEEVIANIAPRPVLLLHSSADQVTPTEQSIAMFKLAGQPCDLHLFAETDHFMFASTNLRVWTVIRDWLEKYFPVR